MMELNQQLINQLDELSKQALEQANSEQSNTGDEDSKATASGNQKEEQANRENADAGRSIELLKIDIIRILNVLNILRCS